MTRKPAFTLVEVLVVIAIIGLLIAILLPALSAAKAQAQRIACAARLRQLMDAVHVYADDFNGRLPPGYRDNNTEEHTIWICRATYNGLMSTLRNPKMLVCPNLDTRLPSYPPANIGWTIGYAYLGDRLKIMAAQGWRSPVKTSNPASLPVFCDLNDWSPADGWTAVAHPRRGPGDFFMDGGLPPQARGSTGGNVAYLDGSVAWRSISAMTAHQTYSQANGAYMGLW